jgi:tellurite resistance protein
VLRRCREVAAADGEPGAAETEMLNDVARVLGGK